MSGRWSTGDPPCAAAGEARLQVVLRMGNTNLVSQRIGSVGSWSRGCEEIPLLPVLRKAPMFGHGAEPGLASVSQPP